MITDSWGVIQANITLAGVLSKLVILIYDVW